MPRKSKSKPKTVKSKVQSKTKKDLRIARLGERLTAVEDYLAKASS